MGGKDSVSCCSGGSKLADKSLGSRWSDPRLPEQAVRWGPRKPHIRHNGRLLLTAAHRQTPLLVGGAAPPASSSGGFSLACPVPGWCMLDRSNSPSKML